MIQVQAYAKSNLKVPYFTFSIPAPLPVWPGYPSLARWISLYVSHSPGCIKDKAPPRQPLTANSHLWTLSEHSVQKCLYLISSVSVPPSSHWNISLHPPFHDGGWREPLGILAMSPHLKQVPQGVPGPEHSGACICLHIPSWASL